MTKVRLPYIVLEGDGYAVHDPVRGQMAFIKSPLGAAQLLQHLTRIQSAGAVIDKPHLVYNPWDQVFSVVDPEGEMATITGDHSVAIRMLRAVTEQIEQDRQDQEAQGQQESQQL